MAKGNRDRQTALTVMAGTIVTVVVITCLYWAQVIFIPLALAVFLAFLLSPFVSFLQRLRLGRIPAVLAAVFLMVVVFAGMVWLVTSQISGLAARLPQYANNIQAKVETVTDRMEVVTRYFNTFLGTQPEASPPDAERPAVVVKTASSEWASHLLAWLAPVAQGVGGGVLAFVLTAFILLKREDLRNRLICLAGEGRITMATRAFDEAGQRISKFLVMQALIGAIAGSTIGLGLLVLGVEYALLWGFLIFLLRYVPYIGVWCAAVPPVLLSFAMFEGWGRPLMVVGLIVCVELFCAYVLEPWWYGRSMGVSEFALLVSAAVWAFLWGPIGMVLSSPLTVCLVVLGKYHPRMKFLDILLGDEPALGPNVSFYQRLLARDQDEAVDIVQTRLEESSPDKVFDELVIPALVYAKRDRERDDLPDDDEDFILRATTEIGEELAERLEGSSSADVSGPAELRALGCPAHDAEDEAALRLLAATLDPGRWQMEVLSLDKLGSEVVSRTGEKQPDLICIAALPPGGLAHTRYLCKRLRSRFPRVKILVARWGLESGAVENAELLRQAGADFVTTTLVETRERMNGWGRLPVQETNPPPSRREREGASASAAEAESGKKTVTV